MLVRTHMQDLKDVTRETHYENYRAHCIQSMTRMVVKERNRKYVDTFVRESSAVNFCAVCVYESPPKKTKCEILLYNPPQ